MTLWRTIGEVLAHWTDTVATGVIALASRFFSARLVRLVEDDNVLMMYGSVGTPTNAASYFETLRTSSQ